ncbi:MAG: hypothetical protein WCL28_02860 [bacterium]
MGKISFARIFVGSLLGSLLLVLIAVGIVSIGVKESQARANQLKNNVTDAVAELPYGDPEIGQAAINTALNAFGIQIPKNVKGPFFSEKLEDRGLTLKRGVMADSIVYIGPEAFSSWSLLGSTLAHEIEIHCRQNFLAIHFQNISGFDGTGIAEREAYSYELHQAERFGLSEYERDLIRSTMAYFYPERENRLAQKLAPIKFWVDRLSATRLGNPSF